MIYAGKSHDTSALASAILSQERQHFARAKIERNISDSHRPPKRFGYTAYPAKDFSSFFWRLTHLSSAKK
jgi:hypothetical protein